MDNLHKELKQLKDEIFNNNLDTKTEDHASVNRILKLDDINNELKEVLILLTNNYTAELQAIRHHQVKSLMAIIDSDISLLNKYKEILIKLDNVEKTVDTVLNDDKFSFFNIIKYIGTGMVVITFLTLLYHHEPVGVSKAIDAVKTFLGIGVDVIKDFD